MKTDNFQIRTILLADDDSDDREFFHDALLAVAEHITLITAENGLQALEILNNAAQPDLIFLDLNMPLKNGYECLVDIKQNDRLKHFSVIVFSTSLQPETADIVFDSGASLYIVKPNSFPALKNLLKEVLAFDWKHLPGRVTRGNFILQA